MEKLQRSKKDRIIAGVCGGLAKYFGVDPTLIRLIFIVGVFLKGITVLIYLVLAIIMPEEGAEESGENVKTEEEGLREPEISEGLSETRKELPETRKKLLAYSLILIGVLFFVKDMIPFWISDSQLFAVILILIGIGLLVSKR